MRRIRILFLFIVAAVTMYGGGSLSYNWVRHVGAVVTGDPTNDEGAAYEPNVVLDGSTFKMWWTGGWGATAHPPHINYSTSSDGITWSGGSSVLAGYQHSFVFKSGSTYYMYAVPGATPTQFDFLTSSNGTTWVLDTAKAIDKGTSAWDDTEMGNIVVWIESASDWRALYEARTSTGGWHIGYATSTDGKTWSKSGSNPVINETGSTGGPWIYKNGASDYWLWVHHSLTGFLPLDEERYKSSDLVTWTRLPTKNVLTRYTADEGLGLLTGGIGDFTMVETAGQTYVWYGAGTDATGPAGSIIKLAIAPMTMAKLILTNEGP